ncbi:hypothetical protein A8C56_03000 [Niabella ginsenosidivorans]|uniref:Uncharacterized protein n=1 Tax=Niabella ginsenosidivorans TaxID=1176587 RepID=A0A1A9HZ63_9BACT|nr:hypothetical protein [Niabella ginsenosidivorans]ANH80089.1 hypothetical protein A8C56_03000 [Niabella ginsenosidivorans]
MNKMKKAVNNIRKTIPQRYNKKGQHECFTTLKKIAREQWSKGPQTMKQVSVATGIVRDHLCRFTSEWRRERTMYVHHVGVCPVTGTGGVMFLALCHKNSLVALKILLKQGGKPNA